LALDGNGYPEGFAHLNPLLWIKNPKNFEENFEPNEGEIHVLVVFPEVDQDGNRKHPRIENDPHPCFEIIDLTIKLKSFAIAQLVEGCIQSQDQLFLPYQQDNIQTLYVRQCYQDVFQLLIQRINLNQKSQLQPNIQLAGFKCYKDCATCTTNRNSTLLFLHISLQPLGSRVSQQ
jgi:hypothetical protein